MAKEKQPVRRKKIDWDAIKRDYRTDRFTDTELSEKHKIPRETISRKRTLEIDGGKQGWEKDLREAINRATDAALVREIVTERHEKVTDVVLAVAEVTKNVILTHRSDISATRGLTVDLMQELRETKMLVEDKELLAQILAGSGASPSDEAQARMIVRKALDIGNRISSAKTLAETFTKLQAAERIAFALDAEGKKPEEESDSPTRIHSFTTEELVAIAGGK